MFDGKDSCEEKEVVKIMDYILIIMSVTVGDQVKLVD